MAAKVKVFVRSEDVVSCELEGGSALLDIRSSVYFRLNETANFLWERLERSGMDAHQLAEEVAQVYEVDKAECLPDVLAMLSELEAANLIIAKS